MSSTRNNTAYTPDRGITIRRLNEADEPAVRALAGRDSAPVPEGELLGLEVEGRLVAAQPLDEGAPATADPFARTAEVQALLELRAEQLRARRRDWAPQRKIERPLLHNIHRLSLFARVS